MKEDEENSSANNPADLWLITTPSIQIQAETSKPTEGAMHYIQGAQR